MKKKILALTMTLVLALGFSACGSKTTGSDKSTSESGETSGADAFKDGVADNKSSEDDEDENENALIDWYESDGRKNAEKIINETFSEKSRRFFVEVEEPDVLIYNFQYKEQVEVTDLLLEQLEQGLDRLAESVIGEIQNYRDTYGIDLYAIRVVYLNADGSVIYEREFTEDYELSASAGDFAFLRSYADLQEWMDSDEAAQLLEFTNNLLASSGISVDFSAEDNTFVYEYYLSEESYEETGMANYSEEQLQDAIESVVESQRASLESIFTDFERDYGLTLDAVRVVFYQEDGTFIGSTDLLNEKNY